MVGFRLIPLPSVLLPVSSVRPVVVVHSSVRFYVPFILIYLGSIEYFNISFYFLAILLYRCC